MNSSHKTPTTYDEIEHSPVSKLIFKYSLPAIISGIAGALYNIVDQIFIGNIIGVEGNAATNVTFPLVTLTIAILLWFGVGGAVNFSLSMGRKDTEAAKGYLGTTLTMAFVIAVCIGALGSFYSEYLVNFFGATSKNYALANIYLKITALGYPFFILTEVGTRFIRADGAPRYAMFCSLIGVLLNCILNPLYMIVFDLGMQGAALATITGQCVSFLIVIRYFFAFKSFNVQWNNLIPQGHFLKRILILGSSQAINLCAIMATQIVMNNTLKYYGASSIYGTEIPLACVGIIAKVNAIYVAIMVGIAQGAQPILSYCYGAKIFNRVSEAYIMCLKFAAVLSVVVFLCFQIFPQYILSWFGADGMLYYEFGVKYFRIFMFMVFLNGIQPVTGNFFAAIGKPFTSATISLSRELFFLIPLVLAFPYFFHIQGFFYAGPVADIFTFLATLYFVRKELKKLRV